LGLLTVDPNCTRLEKVVVVVKYTLAALISVKGLVEPVVDKLRSVTTELTQLVTCTRKI